GARDLLDRMGVGGLSQRRPAELSGGQQQRVGVARALARDAALYLFDEPTAHLDTALRAALQEEVAERRRDAGAAALYATHDAAEALAVADRVALLREGRIAQAGTPRDVYERPVDLWAAQLTGPAAVLRVEVLGEGPGLRIRVGDVEVEVASDGSGEAGGRSLLDAGQDDGGVVVHGGVPVGGGAGEPRAAAGAGSARSGPRAVLVRPEWTALGGPLSGTVRGVWYRGPYTDYRIDTPGGQVTVRRPGPPRARTGERVGWRLDRVWLLSAPDGA
ncbi:MAG TPA: ATP-binding cassette domain-containing protein, partial [Nitriliruptorales bacterium]|nr:ATP-binding cassette domain-containing protein [Nitriliruptorales bacterium]